MQSIEKINILFVCTGNICRSPMAEAIFNHLVNKSNLESRFKVQSAGTDSWHIGERPCEGTLDILKKKGVALHPQKRAQKVMPSHLVDGDYVIVMDKINQAKLDHICETQLLMEFAPPGNPLEVPDPFYEHNFAQVFELVQAGCEGLLTHIREQEGI